MFTKIKTRAGNTYAYRMLVNFKSVTYKKKNLTSRLDVCTCSEAALSDITRVFAWHCPMAGANILTCNHTIFPRQVYIYKVNFWTYTISLN